MVEGHLRLLSPRVAAAAAATALRWKIGEEKEAEQGQEGVRDTGQQQHLHNSKLISLLLFLPPPARRRLRRGQQPPRHYSHTIATPPPLCSAPEGLLW